MSIPDSLISTVEVASQGVFTLSTGATKNVQAIFHYRRAAVMGLFDRASLANSFNNVFVIPWMALASSNLTMNTVTVRVVDDAQDPPVPFPFPQPGLIVTDREPSINAVYYKFQTLVRGKSFRGSKHLAGVVEADTTGDLLTGAGLTAWLALTTQMMTPLADAGGNAYNLVVLSRKLSHLLVNPTTVITTSVVAVNINKRIGVMRRRRSPSSY
jgi:hypothetical protein